MQSLIIKKKQLIDDGILREIYSEFQSSEVNTLVRYFFQTGGKRCRPILLLLSNEALGGDQKRALDAAVAIELIHAASLIFDDIIDTETVRRRRPSMHHVFGEDKAISVGLFLASKGVEILSRYNNDALTQTLADALVKLSKGEILDAISSKTTDPESYLNIADLKTGALFSAAAAIGAILAEASEDEVKTFAEYGRLVGIAFQARDDALDSEKTGGSISKRPTNCGSGLEISTGFTSADCSIQNAKGTLSVPAFSGALISQVSREYIERAKSELRKTSAQIEQLEEFADYMLEREE